RCGTSSRRPCPRARAPRGRDRAGRASREDRAAAASPAAAGEEEAAVDAEAVSLLRRDLRAADFTVDALRASWGDRADAALARGERVPALRALAQRETSPLVTLARLFVLGTRTTERDVESALPGLGATGAARLGLTGADPDGGVRALVDLRPYAIGDGRGEDE